VTKVGDKHLTYQEQADWMQKIYERTTLAAKLISKNKVEKKKKEKKTDNSNISKQLKTLNNLYKSGALTKEEFEKAKKKLLN
jgi:predicted patatin/cPLA2 family phospholipase